MPTARPAKTGVLPGCPSANRENIGNIRKNPAMRVPYTAAKPTVARRSVAVREFGCDKIFSDLKR
jgi:hypothetical protein